MEETFCADDFPGEIMAAATALAMRFALPPTIVRPVVSNYSSGWLILLTEEAVRRPGGAFLNAEKGRLRLGDTGFRRTGARGLLCGSTARRPAGRTGRAAGFDPALPRSFVRSRGSRRASHMTRIPPAIRQSRRRLSRVRPAVRHPLVRAGRSGLARTVTVARGAGSGRPGGHARRQCVAHADRAPEHRSDGSVFRPTPTRRRPSRTRTARSPTG